MFRDARQILHKHGKTGTAAPPALLPILSAEALLETERRQQLLKVLPSLSQLPPKEYQALYLKLVHCFAEFVQQLPETKGGHFPYAGGLLDHGLERAVRALALSRGYFGHMQTQQQGETKEVVLAQAMLRYAIFSAALLYDLGRLATKIQVVICDEEGTAIKPWHLYEGAMSGQGTHYKYTFGKENWDYLRGMVTPLLARQLMMQAGGLGLTRDKLISAKEGFSWIAQDKETLETWFALFKENSQQVDALLAIIPSADAQVILHELTRFSLGLDEGAPDETIELVDEATEKWGLSERKFSDKKQQELNEIAERFAEEEDLKSLPEEKKTWEGLESQVAERKLATVPATMAAGLAFFRWLLKNIRANKLTVNRADSVLHRVDEGVLVTQEAFKLFCDTHAKYKDPKVVQQQFAQLELTLAAADNHSLFHYNLGKGGMLQGKEGMILHNPRLLFHDKALPEINKNLQLSGGVLKNFATAKAVIDTLKTVSSEAQPLLPKSTKPGSPL
ncbi:MAG: TraI domain-containing protein [Gammaproteobacteria bacterium]|nr:TraI domain-containing protein [Gammaproteobacteria bacterium]